MQSLLVIWGVMYVTQAAPFDEDSLFRFTKHVKIHIYAL